MSILFQLCNGITKLGIPFSRILHCDPFVFFGHEPRHGHLVIREGIDSKRPWPRALAVISGSGIAVRNGTITRAILAPTLGALLCRLLRCQSTSHLTTMEKVCVVGFGGACNVVYYLKTFTYALEIAIGALYAFALEKSGKVEVTAVCRYVQHRVCIDIIIHHNRLCF